MKINYLLIISFTILLSGCGQGVSPALLHQLNTVCKNHGGVSYFKFSNDKVTCMNGKKFRLEY